MIDLSTTQKKIFDLLLRSSARGQRLTDLQIGIVLDQPQRHAAAWARCHLRGLIEAGMIEHSVAGYGLPEGPPRARK